MKILTIDTCTDTSTLGIVAEGAVLAQAAFPSRLTLAQRLLMRLDWLLDEVGLAKSELEAIAVTLGPGSFTGVRIGLAAAKTLAVWMQKPLIGLSTLEALAYPFRMCTDSLLVPVINARRQQVYTAPFRSNAGTLERLASDQVLSAEPFAEFLHAHAAKGQPILLIGITEGLPAAFREHFPANACRVRSFIEPHAIAEMARARLQHGEADDPVTLAAIYLRAPAD